MPLVHVFTRTTLAHGREYPAGAKVPSDCFSARTLMSRLSAGIIYTTEDVGQDFPESREPVAPPVEARASRVALEIAEEAVTDLKTRLAAATAELEDLYRRSARGSKGALVAPSAQETPDESGAAFTDESPLDVAKDEPNLPGLPMPGQSADARFTHKTPAPAEADNDEENKVPANLPVHLR
jgi:hypothetical protein